MASAHGISTIGPQSKNNYLYGGDAFAYIYRDQFKRGWHGTVAKALIFGEKAGLCQRSEWCFTSKYWPVTMLCWV
jgi:hypothetical protein